jgi:hypothetical protein
MIVCDKCRKELSKVHYNYDFMDAKYKFCKTCHSKLGDLIGLTLQLFIEQPERLNPEDVGNNVCDSLNTTNK